MTDDELLAKIETGLAKAAASGVGAKPDPPIWEFGNPFTDIWNPNKKDIKFGYYEKPSSKAAVDFYNLNDTELRRFQELSFQAGYYGAGAERTDIRWGAKDDTTYAIWNDFVGRAARVHAAGKKNTLWDLLQDDVDKRPENLNKGRKREPLVNVLPDAREIEQTLMALAPDVIGRDPDPEFIADFTAMYTSMVSEFNKNRYALAGTEEGGEITAPPSAESIAAFRLRHEKPEEYERHRSAEKHMQYLSLLKGAL